MINIFISVALLIIAAFSLASVLGFFVGALRTIGHGILFLCQGKKDFTIKPWASSTMGVDLSVAAVALYIFYLIQ